MGQASKGILVIKILIVTRVNPDLKADLSKFAGLTILMDCFQASSKSDGFLLIATENIDSIGINSKE